MRINHYFNIVTTVYCFVDCFSDSSKSDVIWLIYQTNKWLACDIPDLKETWQLLSEFAEGDSFCCFGKILCLIIGPESCVVVLRRRCDNDVFERWF